MAAIRQRKTTLCLESWYYLVVMGFILAGAILREINLLIALFGMMVGPLLYNWRSVIICLRGLEIKRRLPAVIRAGDLLVVDVELTNTRRFGASWALVAEDTLRREGTSTSVPGTEGRVLFTHLPAGEMRKQSYQGRLMQRGRYTFDRLKLSTRFPLGLVRRTLVFDLPATLLVYPRLGRLTRHWSRRFGDAAQGSRRATPRQGFLEGDYHGLRNFRSGDSQRWIHWRTSARRGMLMVREFEQQRNQDLCLLLDLWQPVEPAREQLENVELAVSFAASVLADRCRRGGCTLVLGTAAQQVKLTRGAASNSLLHDALETLSVAEATTQDRLPELLAQALESLRPGTSVVLVSTRPQNLADSTRFANLWSDPRQRAWLSRVFVLDAGTPQLLEYFQPE